VLPVDVGDVDERQMLECWVSGPAVGLSDTGNSGKGDDFLYGFLAYPLPAFIQWNESLFFLSRVADQVGCFNYCLEP
jgi:hypothetical protein